MNQSHGVSTSCLRRLVASAILIAGLQLGSAPLLAQGFDLVIPTSQIIVDGAETPVAPGARIGLAPGERTRLVFRNLHGTAEAPIVITNMDALVRVGSPTAAEAVKFENCSHFALRGDGVPGLRYGIEIHRAGGQGVEVTSLSTNFELCFLEIHGAGFAGIMAKTDPKCGGYATRGTFVQYDTHIHHNYIHDVQGEALYIGNSFYSGVPSGITGCGPLLPHDLVGVRVHDNIVERTGFDGIQVGCASVDCEIYDNIVRNTGLRGIPSHQNGIQIGEGTTGLCYNNVVSDAASNGIVMLGLGNNTVFNNLIVRTGTNGIFCDDRPDTIPGSFIRIFNNTIVNPAKSAFLVYSEVGTNEFRNNLAVVPNGAFGVVDTGSGAIVSVSGNLMQRTSAGLGFVNEATLDYRVQAGSPAIDAGVDLSAWGVTDDLEGLGRPSGAGWDVGAHEFGALSLHLHARSPATFGATDGSIVVSALGGTAPYAFSWSDGPVGPVRSGLGAGRYVVTVSDAGGAVEVREIWLTEPPRLVVSAKVLPALAGGSNGSVSLTVAGGRPPYTCAWSNGATTMNVIGLPVGFHGYSVTDANGDVTTGTAYVRDAGTPLYRIDAGGAEILASLVNWTLDKTSNPSVHLTNPSASRTTGSNSWSGGNETEGPNNLFGAYRTAKTGAADMLWSFPVAPGFYEVQLYFNERVGTIEEGDRVFDVLVEDAPVLPRLDLAARHGFDRPAQYTYFVEVNDGALDLRFARVAGDPVVSAIAVHAHGASLPSGTPQYRVNCGGIDEPAADGVTWLKDKKTAPSPYLVSIGQHTSGSNKWTDDANANLTDAPDNVFGNWRFDTPGSPQEMRWAFPAESGLYRVSLYFMEREPGIVAPWQRFFDVRVEGALFLADYDPFAFYGPNVPACETAWVEVTDGELNVDFAHRDGGGNPVINAIAVHRVR